MVFLVMTSCVFDGFGRYFVSSSQTYMLYSRILVVNAIDIILYTVNAIYSVVYVGNVKRDNNTS